MVSRLTSLEKRISKLQEQADIVRRREAAKAVKEIQALMARHSLSADDLGKTPGRRGRPPKAAAAANGAASPRTSASTAAKHPGFPKGKMAAKYRDPKTGLTWSGHARPPAWIKNVKDRTKFLINPADAVASTSAAAKKGASKTATKAASKKTASAATKKAAKKAPAKKVALKKVAAKKAVAKKAPAKKASAKTAAKKGPSSMAKAIKQAATRKAAKTAAKKAPAKKSVSAKKSAPAKKAVASAPVSAVETPEVAAASEATA